MPSPGPGEVVVEVRAAGINPGEAAHPRRVRCTRCFPATFPSGEGSDLAGVVTAVGPGVTEFSVGDEVLGFSFQPVQPCHPHRGPGGSTDPQTSPIELGGSGFAVRGRRNGVCGCACGRPAAGRDRRRFGGRGRSRQPRRAAVGAAQGTRPGHRGTGQRRLAASPRRHPDRLRRRAGRPVARGGAGRNRCVHRPVRPRLRPARRRSRCGAGAHRHHHLVSEGRRSRRQDRGQQRRRRPRRCWPKSPT